MTTEKIAFLFPYHKSEGNDKLPMLLMETTELPVTVDVFFQVHFLGLEHSKEYWFAANLYREEDGLEISMSGEKGVWIRAKGYPGSKNTLATSMGMHFERCKFESEGDYLIGTSLTKDGILIHEAHAFFSVSKVDE
ncbi:hypothetical protein GNG26_10120 [Leclercia sp. J807]|uniref:hypothetical protein n=1 Tax=Leclercia sp. J807 TaxID=2681307 RepID=UPI0012E12A6F|nr:hypothetical protein [Leclercia sp. J807]QGU10688.1 hypothetical protein GNG26_10120 [Leclercia sp. J807]